MTGHRFGGEGLVGCAVYLLCPCLVLLSKMEKSPSNTLSDHGATATYSFHVQYRSEREKDALATDMYICRDLQC